MWVHAQTTIRQRLARSGGVGSLDDTAAARLALFAALHDIGKVNIGFQTQIWRDDDFPAGRGRPGHASHYHELAPVLRGGDGGMVLKKLHGVLFQPSKAELVMPAEVKVMAWKKGSRNGVVVRGAGGPGAEARLAAVPFGSVVMCPGARRWNMRTARATTAGAGCR